MKKNKVIIKSELVNSVLDSLGVEKYDIEEHAKQQEEYNKAYLKQIEGKSEAEIIMYNLRNFKKVNDAESIVLEIPLLSVFYKRGPFSLSDYIIFLIILAHNIEGRLFSESNDYFTYLVGIKKAQVEKSLKKLIQMELIDYVSMFGKLTDGIAPISKKAANEKMHEFGFTKIIDLPYLPVNDKRQFIAIIDNLHFFVNRGDVDFHTAYSKENKEMERSDKKWERKIKISAEKAIKTLSLRNVNIEHILKYNNSEFKENNNKEYELINITLETLNLFYSDLSYYIRKIRKNKNSL